MNTDVIETASKKLNLFVCTWAPPMAGGPRNLYNHLKSWDPDSYAIITSYLNFSWSVLEPSTWLPCKYEYFDYHDQPMRNQIKIHVESTRIRFKLVDKYDKLLNKISNRLQRMHYSNPNLFDTLYQLGRSIRVVLACYLFSKKNQISRVTIISDMGWGFIGGFIYAWIFEKPLNIFLFDLYADNYMLSGNKILANFFEPYIFKYADKIIVTNETTAAFLQNKYPFLLDITIVRNSSDLPPRDIKEIETVSTKSEREFNISFAGHVYWPHYESFENLVTALKILNDKNIFINMYVINPGDEVNKIIQGQKNIRLSYLPREELAKELQNADLLFIPFGWNTKSNEIIHTASPAKFTDYLSVGVPLLVHAPQNSFVSSITKEKKLGLVVTENSAEALAKKILDYKANDKKIKVEYAKNCIHYYNNEYSVEMNSKKLSEVTFGNH